MHHPLTDSPNLSLSHHGPPTPSSIIEKENIPHCGLTEELTHHRTGASSRRDSSSNSGYQAIRERRAHCRRGCGPHSNEGREEGFLLFGAYYLFISEILPLLTHTSYGGRIRYPLTDSLNSSLSHRGPATPPSIIEKENIPHCGLTHRRTGASSRTDSPSNSAHQAVRERRVHCRRGCGPHTLAILGPQPHHPLLKRKTPLTVDRRTGASSRKDSPSNSAH
ncbi:hypothetical protein CDAR_227351 [Caerostris darwini]|uniref:Uncharacterized protein n=1 Tax=Caerostris darwini TaxID=1538125 RepID=A0AAV4UM42_9ARAC|nr:hypothetical protein CDAR_227351 [Caerostris darwini]